MKFPNKAARQDYLLKQEIDQGDIEVSWEDIKDKPTIPSLSGYATEDWVGEQGYLTSHQDISGKADKSEIFSGSYNDLTGKPSLSNVSDAEDEADAVTKLNTLLAELRSSGLMS